MSGQFPDTGFLQDKSAAVTTSAAVAIAANANRKSLFFGNSTAAVISLYIINADASVATVPWNIAAGGSLTFSGAGKVPQNGFQAAIATGTGNLTIWEG